MSGSRIFGSGPVSFSPAEVQADAAHDGPKKPLLIYTTVLNGSGRPVAIQISQTNVDPADPVQRQATTERLFGAFQGTGLSRAQIDDALQPGGVLAQAIANGSGEVEVYAIEAGRANAQMSAAAPAAVPTAVTTTEAVLAPPKAKAVIREVTFPSAAARNAVLGKRMQDFRSAFARGVHGGDKATVLADAQAKLDHTKGQLALADPLFADYHALRAELMTKAQSAAGAVQQNAYLRAIGSLDSAAAAVSPKSYNPEAGYSLNEDGTIEYMQTPNQRAFAEELRQAHNVSRDRNEPRLAPLGDPNDPLYGLSLY